MRCVAINVTDFAVGYRFWSAVTGYEILGPEQGWHGWLGYLGTTAPRKHEIILINTDTAPIRTEAPTHHLTNHVHVDITPTGGVDAAIEQILELGGSVKKPPSLYPRPGTAWRGSPGHRLGRHAGPVRQRVLPRPRSHHRTIRSRRARRETRSDQRPRPPRRCRTNQTRQQRHPARTGVVGDQSSCPNVSTTLPTLWPPSTRRCASTICANGRTESMTGFSTPCSASDMRVR